MARKSTITPETVAAAAEALIARGEPVTNKSVLSEIGSGSMSTLVPLLQTWRETQRETQELAEVEVPDALAASAERLASQLWKAAMVEATAGHEALRRELVTARAETAQVQAEMLDLLAGAESERDAMRDTADALSMQQTALEAERDEMGRTIARLETENARLVERVEARTAEAATARQRADDAVAREGDMRAARDEVRAELSKVRDELAEVRGQLNSKVERLEAVQADLGTARADLVKERAEHAGTREKLTERLERASVDLEAAQEAEAAMRTERDAALEQAAELADRVRELEAERALMVETNPAE